MCVWAERPEVKNNHFCFYPNYFIKHKIVCTVARFSLLLLCIYVMMKTGQQNDKMSILDWKAKEGF